MPSNFEIALFFHSSFLVHDTGFGHPERAERLKAILAHLKASPLWPRLKLIEPEPAAVETIELVHPPSYVQKIQKACQEGPTHLDPDTVASPGSWEAARRAVGAVTQAINQIIEGKAKAAFCAVRPPGHHALAERAMGFCLFNNVAIGVRYAQKKHGLERVLIVDWDVHHGNGTQGIFYEDPSVFYFSTHQYPFYPGTGARHERGEGRGKGYTLNVPLAAGSGDREIIEAFEKALMPKAIAFKPDLVLISAGFDAHRDDPLAGLNVTEQGYARLTEIVREIALASCHGRIVSVLEGGYNLDAISHSVEAHLGKLI